MAYKLIISLILLLLTFNSLSASAVSATEQYIQIFQGSDPKQRSSYMKLKGMNLNESEVAVLFIPAEGSNEKELRFQYSLGYYPQTALETGERRVIRVRVDQPNLAVRARESYTQKR